MTEKNRSPAAWGKRCRFHMGEGILHGMEEARSENGDALAHRRDGAAPGSKWILYLLFCRTRIPTESRKRGFQAYFQPRNSVTLISFLRFPNTRQQNKTPGTYTDKVMGSLDFLHPGGNSILISRQTLLQTTQRSLTVCNM